MNVLNARIDWKEQWANDPSLEILVGESYPSDTEFRYEKKDTLYFAEKDDFVSYYSWSGRGNDGGFGKRHFPIILTDGTQITLQGPWSSRSSVMNMKEFTHSKECRIITNGNIDAFQRQIGYIGGAITVKKIREILAQFCPEATIVQIDQHGELMYQIVLKDGRPKPNLPIDPIILSIIQTT